MAIVYRDSPEMAGERYSHYDKATKQEYYVTNQGRVAYNRQTHTVVEACIGLPDFNEDRYDLRVYDGQFQLARVDMYGNSQAEFNSPQFPYKNGVGRLGSALTIQVLENGSTYSTAINLAVREALGILGRDKRLGGRDQKLLAELFANARQPIVKE